MKRNFSLDVIKWFAISTMVIDHLRLITYFAEYNNFLVVIGRFAFPLFAFVLAYNFHRILKTEKYYTLKKYLTNLFVFSLISEIPYRLLEQNPTTINVMPTLLAGLIFMMIQESKLKYKYMFLGAFSFILILSSDWLMYGFLGVILPATCLIALKQSNKLWIALPATVAALCNAQYLIHSAKLMPFLVVSIVVCAALSILLAFNLIRKNLNFNIFPVAQWGYWFYPTHLFIFYLINYLRSQ